MDWLNRFSQSPSIAIDGRDIPIAVRRHPTARRLTMRLAPDGSEIRVTMPRWGQSREAIAFATSRRAWLEQQLSAICAHNPPQHGSILPFRGTDLVLHWDPLLPRKPAIAGTMLQIGGTHESLAARTERWLRAEALAVMRDDLAHYCQRAEVAAPALALSRARRRWGSCSSTGTVRMNWRLIMAPDAVRRSVVAHEVAHLVHFDHSPAFHALLAELFEGDIEHANCWLKAEGRRLYSYFG